ncbi:Prephenate dehydratase [Paenibacillus vortex V453]|jgi:prephenate dehydratase|uniref:Prephenate dehydratase n=3 Tax=Paenibacillus TaxID=44249 RepID=A0A163KSR4_9BACL|nr:MULTISPECIES: prephenate dehydratase [Paenibacillus]ANA81441.1 prephenate dehydratase [Paenibacillus glucanolyticus]AVV59828.1 prephenate dehydratase [Paenibacillus glucanolyticus]AWP29083.1 prephenate dehydratase [Paenibacillus sp. Cedars]EFU42153.1 Prephenate dehydratase [Paenibacillus vortex V453]ETT35681.1 prephenate dehydratase [Paenibacillus sp. FSL R5-808]
MKKIALLPSGSVSHEAIRYLLNGEPVEFVHYKLISDVFMSTVEGKSDYSVIPIENTIEGSVSLHMDWLVNEVDLPMQVEWVYPSIQNLIGNASEFLTSDGTMDYSQIKKIWSHQVATAQCRQFLAKAAPQAELEQVGSTSEGVKIVKDNPGQGWAAIGTSLGAATHGLNVLAERITDHDNNYTRFVLIGRDPISINRSPEHIKTSILVTLPEDVPGALHQVLSAFAWRRLNLSRIESRPTKKKLGNYYFYIDVMASTDSVLLVAAMGEIEALGCLVRVLGSYPGYAYEREKMEVK